MKPFEILQVIKKHYLNFDLYYNHNRISKNESERNDWLLNYKSKYKFNNSFLFREGNTGTLNHFSSVDSAIKIHDINVASWLYFDTPKIIWEFIETHHKPTGDIFYSLGIELMNEHDLFLLNIERFKVECQLDGLPLNEVHTNSMELRILSVKRFIFNLTKYSLELKKELKFTEEEIIKFKDIKSTLNHELPKIKQPQKSWNTHTRYTLLSSKFPEIIDTLHKITLASDRNKLLAQIMGIHEDTAKNLFNGSYKHDTNDSELKDMNDFLNKINSNK